MGYEDLIYFFSWCIIASALGVAEGHSRDDVIKAAEVMRTLGEIK